MASDLAYILHTDIASQCPIHGVSLGRHNDKSTWRIHFKDEASAQQRIIAQNVLDTFDIAKAEDDIRKEEEKEARIQQRMRELAEKLEADPTILNRIR